MRVIIFLSLLLPISSFATEEIEVPELTRETPYKKRKGSPPTAYALAKVMTDLLAHRHFMGVETPALYAVQDAIDCKYWAVVPLSFIHELETKDLTFTLYISLRDTIERGLMIYNDNELFRVVLSLESTDYREYLFDPNTDSIGVFQE